MKFIIKELIVYNSNRFNLNKIKKIIYRPIEGLNLILGTNGSGKSSLLDYLTLLPLDKEDFNTGGYRELKFIYNRNEYIVSTGKIGVNKHSFIKNGEELNGGYTRKMYMRLLYEEFGIDQKIMDIVNLKKKFIQQSFAERGNWFGIITKNNLEYPLNIYNELKRNARDIQGYIKLEKSNLNNLLSKQLDKESIKLLKEDLHILKLVRDNINSLFKQNNDNTNRDLILELDKEIKELKNILNQANREIDIKSKDKLTATLNKLRGEINSRIDILDKFSTNTTNIEELKKEISDIKNNIDLLINIFKNILEVEDINIYNIDNIYNYLIENYEEIYTLIDNIEEIKIDVVIDNEYIDKTKLIKIHLESMKNDYNKIEAELKHILSHKDSDDVECPSCKTRFKPLYDQDKVNTLETNLNAQKRKIEALESEFKIRDENISKFNHKKQLLEHLYSKLTNLKLHKFKDLNKIKLKLNQILSFKDKAIDIISSNNKLLSLEKDLKLFESGINKTTLENELNKLKETSIIFENKIKLIDKEITNIERAKKIYNSILNKLYSLNKYSSELFILKLKEIMLEPLNELDSVINDLERKINTIDHIEKQINDIKRNLVIKEKELIVLNKTINVLSPKDGLIAESIMSLLEYLIDTINEIINSIWEYPLEVIIPDFEENGLRYNFLLKVDNDKVRKDIAYGSESMQEIINLAFSLAFTEILELDYLPLFLDEFSSSFDTTHKLKTISFVNKLISNRQCFMITHEVQQMLEASHNDTSVVILDNKNLNVDIKSTDNIYIEYE